MKIIKYLLGFFLLSCALVYGWIILNPYELDKEKLNTTHYEKLENMPMELKSAIIETEDGRFYQHYGIDLIGIGRAALVGAVTGKVSQGGSTITQQVVKNTFLTNEKTIKRKVKEIFIAMNIDYHYGKEEILEYYLNMIYLGNDSYGVSEASLSYFGKEMYLLTQDEIALLSGLPQAPSAYDPYVNSELAKKRRNIVLDIMAREHIITEKEATVLKEKEIKLAN